MPDFSGTTPTGTPTSLDAFNASNQAISFKSQLPDLEQKLREALTMKFSQSPLFAQRETAMQGFLNAPSQARSDISQMQQSSGVPLSPTQQQSIESGRRSAAYAPLSGANLLLGSAFGGINDIVGGGVKAFEAASNAQGERATLMNQMQQQDFERKLKMAELGISQAKLDLARQKQEQGPALSASARLKAALYQAGLSQLDKFEQNYQTFTGTGPLKGTFTNLVKNFLPNLADPYLATLQSDIGPLREQIVNAISGANVSKEEAKRVTGWIPANTKSPQENKRNLFSLRTWLQENYDAITGENNSSSDWEIVE